MTNSRPRTTGASATVTNLHAFARLYGVVRWFHPSDAASVIDWDRFAIEGALRVVAAPDRRALQATLTELFAPIAPTVHIVGSHEQFPPEPALHPSPVAGLDVIAWQHEGYGDSTITVGGYTSKRRHRVKAVPVPSGDLFLAVSQSVDAAPYRGKSIRLQGKLRATNHGKARLWLRVDDGEDRGFFDNMIRRPVTNGTWTDAAIVGTVDPAATQIVIGILVLGGGTTWYDDLELSVRASDGAWRPVEIKNGGFEDSAILKSWHPGTGHRSSEGSMEGWVVAIDHDLPAAGANSLRIQPATRMVTDELFDKTPAAGETVDVDLGSGLRARVPIALYSRAGRTIGDDPDVARHSQTAAPAAPARYDALAGAADVIVMWNVLEHFWPYWDISSHADWMAELDKALAHALDDRNIADHVATLERLSAADPDGHSSTSCPGELETGFLPLAVGFIENRIVVTSSHERSIEPGDVIVAIDGVAAVQLLAQEEARVSGSPQWRHVRGLRHLGRGSRGSTVSLELSRGGAELRVSVARVDRPVVPEPLHPAIDLLHAGTYYVDLEQATLQEIEAIMDRLAIAPGVIFDLRGRPNDNHQVLSHLLGRPDDANSWMAIPQIIRPDSPSSPASWKMSGWNLPTMAPRIQGSVVFLTGPEAISYSESVMGLVEYYHLGAIVGEPTAGTNGDIAEIAEPTGCSTIFTGRRVTKPDGSRHYLDGIRPTIYATRTIAGVAARRDEVLERALDYVRQGPGK